MSIRENVRLISRTHLQIWGFINCYMFCCALLCVHSSFCNNLDGGERACCFVLFVFPVYGDCRVALPHNSMGLSSVCDCGIS